MGFEPAACALQVRCSTPELPRPVFVFTKYYSTGRPERQEIVPDMLPATIVKQRKTPINPRYRRRISHPSFFLILILAESLQDHDKTNDLFFGDTATPSILTLGVIFLKPFELTMDGSERSLSMDGMEPRRVGLANLTNNLPKTITAKNKDPPPPANDPRRGKG